MSKAKYSLPYRNCSVARRCTAPFHLSEPSLRHCIDFYLPQGTPILAARAGKVIEAVADYTKSYSHPRFNQRCNRAVIKHSDGELSVYVHLACNSVRVKVGQKVRRGQIVA